MTAIVVYVHGLWFSGAEGIILRRRLSRQLGAEAVAFDYRSVRLPLDANAAALERFVSEIRADTLHLVAHSLGGIVALAMLERLAAASPGRLPPGRVVLMGSPVRGSCSARRLVHLPGGAALLGKTGTEALLPSCDRRWAGGRELGVIAGDSGHGLGRLLGPLREPNDGTVLVGETLLPGCADRVTLDTSHSGMLFSAAVARQVASFLRDGRFAP